jgi:hypothetical protein
VPRLYDAPTPTDFAAIGDDVRKCLAFSYFYLSDGQRIFTPSYKSGSLEWAGLTDTKFRSRFLDSRLSTEIGETGAAEDGGLHEIEFIRHRIGSPAVGTGRVFLCGAAWLKTDGTIAGASLLMKDGLLRLRTREADVDLLDGLTVGGERNDGFGRIQLSDPPNCVKSKLEEIWPSEPVTPMPLNGPLLGHTQYRQDVLFQGQVEIIASREYPVHRTQSFEAPGSLISMHGHFFTPGTVLRNAHCRVTFDSIGQVLLTQVQ